MTDIKQITSPQNPKFKYWASLNLNKNRKKNRQFLVEGARLVTESLLMGASISAVIYCPEFLKNERSQNLIAKIDPNLLYEVPVGLLKKLSTRDMPGEVFAVCDFLESDPANLSLTNLDKVEGRGHPIFVVLENPEGPGNLGTIIRSTEALGADGLIIIGPSVELYHPLVIRSTVGAIFDLPIYQFTSLEDFLNWFKLNGFIGRSSVIAAVAEAEESYNTLSLSTEEPTFLLLGNEQKGLSTELTELANETIAIKMYGRSDSLNTSSAAAILISKLVELRGYGRYPTPYHQRVEPGFEQPK